MDRGRTWSVAGTSATVPFAEAIVASPENNGMLLAGAADALYRSTDGGDTWQRVVIGAVLAVAAAPGLWLVGTESDGVLRSEDEGITWTGANAGLLDLTVTALAVSPSFERDRTAFLGTASGLYRTRNGARAWRAAESDFDVSEPAIQCLAISPNFANDHLVLAGTEGCGLLRSEDAGSTWQAVADLTDHSVTALAFAADGTVAAATEAGIFISRDQAHSWRLSSFDDAPVLSLLFVENTLLAGLALNGVASSDDGGETWTSLTADVSASLLLALALSPSFATDETLFVAGPREGVSVSRDAGRTWQEYSADLQDTIVLGLTVTASHVFVATTEGLFRAGLQEPRWESCVDQPVRAVASSPHPRMLVSAAQARLLASTDDGSTWRTLETHFDADVISLAVAPDSTMYVGSARAGGEITLWRSPDHGSTWQRWLVDHASGGVLPIAISPAHATEQAVYVGIDNRVLSPIRDTREIRGGEHRPLWRAVSLSDAATPVTALTVPHRRIVVAATGGGVFISRDSGQSFLPWTDGLSQVPVVALASTEDDVYALALGGTLWRATIAKSREPPAGPPTTRGKLT